MPNQGRSDEAYRGFRITEFWAWTAIDPADDQEGFVMLLGPSGPEPAWATDRARVESQVPYVRLYAAQVGVPARLRHFVLADDDGLQVVAPPYRN